MRSVDKRSRQHKVDIHTHSSGCFLPCSSNSLYRFRSILTCDLTKAHCIHTGESGSDEKTAKGGNKPFSEGLSSSRVFDRCTDISRCGLRWSRWVGSKSHSAMRWVRVSHLRSDNSMGFVAETYKMSGSQITGPNRFQRLYLCTNRDPCPLVLT